MKKNNVTLEQSDAYKMAIHPVTVQVNEVLDLKDDSQTRELLNRLKAGDHGSSHIVTWNMALLYLALNETTNSIQCLTLLGNSESLYFRLLSKNLLARQFGIGRRTFPVIEYFRSLTVKR